MGFTIVGHSLSLSFFLGGTRKSSESIFIFIPSAPQSPLGYAGALLELARTSTKLSDVPPDLSGCRASLQSSLDLAGFRPGLAPDRVRRPWRRSAALHRATSRLTGGLSRIENSVGEKFHAIIDEEPGQSIAQNAKPEQFDRSFFKLYPIAGGEWSLLLRTLAPPLLRLNLQEQESKDKLSKRQSPTRTGRCEYRHLSKRCELQPVTRGSCWRNTIKNRQEGKDKC
jgi:hypothetical protein